MKSTTFNSDSLVLEEWYLKTVEFERARWVAECYNLSFKLSKRHTLILSNTRELDRVSKYKLSTLYTNYCWFMLHFFSPTLMTMYFP